MTDRLARKPSWLKVKLPKGRVFKDVQNLVKDNALVTVCEPSTTTFSIFSNVDISLSSLYFNLIICFVLVDMVILL